MEIENNLNKKESLILLESKENNIKSFFDEVNISYKKNYSQNKDLIFFLKNNLENLVFKNFEENTIIDENNLSKYVEWIIFIKSAKTGIIDLNDLIIIYKKFEKFIEYYWKNDQKSLQEKLINLILNVNKLNNLTSSILHKYIFNLEKKLFNLIIGKFVENNININDLILFEKKSKYQKSFERKINLIIKDKKIENERRLLIKNSIILKSISFSYKIDILQWLWNNKKINLDELVKRNNFICENRIKELEIKSRSKKIDSVNNYIFDFIIDNLRTTVRYRNNISHLENLIIDNHNANQLLSYLKKQENFLQNNKANEIIYEIKLIFIKNNFISNNFFTKKYYKNFLK